MAHDPYLRFPSVGGDVIVFVADDDVWTAPLAGGMARRLTTDHAPASHPRLSPDGEFIAYTSQRDGIPEAFLVAAAGDGGRRLSYFGDRTTRTIGWRDERSVLAVSAAGEPFRSRTWAWAIPIDGGAPERLAHGPVSGIARGPDGAVVLGVNQSKSRGAAWKRYRGGTAAALWVDADGSGEFVPFMRHLRGQVEDPMFVGDRVVFVSDHEGVGNVYSVLPDGTDLRRHTDHAEFYARAAATDGRVVVYQCAGDLYRLDGLEGDSIPRLIDIELGSPRSGRSRQTLRAAEAMGPHATDRTGRASAVEVRGEIHWVTHVKGPSRLLTGGAGTRARLPRVGGGSGADRPVHVVVVTDAEGEDAIEVVSPSKAPDEAARRIGAGELGRVLEMAASADGRRAAVSTHDGRVVLADLEEGTLLTLAESHDGDASGLCFSPDSRFLAWSQAGPAPLRHIMLASVDGELVREVSPLRFVDDSPAFSLDGKHLAFLSVRTFDPVYDAAVFDLSFAAGARPYVVPLAAATPSPFDPELGGRPRPHGVAEPAVAPAVAPAAPAAPAAAAAGAVELDLDGLAERVVPFPVDAGRYSHLRGAEGGFLWLAEPLSGVLGDERASAAAEPRRARLVRYDFAKAKEIELVEALDGFEVSGDGRSVVLRDERHLRVVPADRKPAPPAPGEEPDPSDMVDVDLERVRVEIDPPVEWTQMFDEAARLMRDHYWIDDMAGVPWEDVVARYRPLLERIASRDDLSELLWEVQGELGSSHAYEMPPERPVEAERRLGLLGADVERDGDGAWRVARILPGESSVLKARSPLYAPGVGVRAGDVIVAVDGRAVDGRFGPAPLLVGAAGKPVQLTVRRRETGEAADVVVEPLEDERPLRYQAWVAERRRAVHEATDGRVGYIHIPDMMGNGWAELHRDLRVEVAREGLVVDVRDNGGGHVSELVLEKLGRTVHAWVTARHLTTETYPQDAPRGPRVLVTNEQAGSDGDIVTAGFRQRELGPVVGTRTWGGVIGIDGRYQLVDGTTVTQPRYAFWFYGLGWDVENYGVDPDIEVPLPPQDWAAGRDPQLDKAIELVLSALAERPAATPPDPSTRASRLAPPLPPRPSPAG